MRTRTWLTTPPGTSPDEADRSSADGERYVPAPDLPREPSVPGRHRRAALIAGAVVTAVAVTVALVVVGEQAQREDPSVPGEADADRPDAPEELELPES